MGAWQEIVDFTVPSNTTSVTFNNFGTITKDDFIKITYTNIRTFASAGNVDLFPNTTSGVSGFNNNSNYTFQILVADAGSIIPARLTGATLFSNAASQSVHATTYFKISENNKVNYFTNGQFQISSTPRVDLFYTTSSITFPDPITSLTFSSISNGIGTNSRIQIYRLTAEKVADVVVASNTTQVNITGLDIKKGDEYLLVSDINTDSNGSNYALFPNNNTSGTNYYSQFITGSGSSASANRFNNNFFSFSNGRSASYTHIKLSNIGAYTHQSYIARNYGANIILENCFTSSTAENITSLTSLSIIGSTNKIFTGSRFELYKLYEGGN